MNKKLLLTMLILALLGGCSQKDGSPVEGNQEGSITYESENPDLANNNAKDEKQNNSGIEIKHLKKLNGSNYTVLNDDRIIISDSEKSIIYNSNFEVIKELEGIKFSNIYEGDIFEYKEPYYENGELGSIYGVMDFDGNILLEADSANTKIIDDDEEGYRTLLQKFISTFESPSEEEEYEFAIVYRHTEEGSYATREYGLARMKIDEYGRLNTEEVEIIIEPHFEAVEDLPEESGALSFNDRYIEFYYDHIDDVSNRNSIAFKENGKWGIVGFDGNIILEAEYGGVTYVDGYYSVVTTKGKKGIFNPDDQTWIIEPSLPSNERVYVYKPFVVTTPDSYHLQSTLYNAEGEVLKEVDEGSITIKDIVDISIDASTDRKISDEFFEVYFESQIYCVDKNSNFVDYDFKYVNTLNMLYSDRIYSVGDKLLLVKQDDESFDVISTEGEFITNLPKSSKTPLFVNEKYLLIGKNVYEISGL